MFVEHHHHHHHRRRRVPCADVVVRYPALPSGVGDKVYIIDKTENNPLTVTSDDGRTHPAWAVSYDINTNEVRAMDVESNPFCAGGMSLANGSWAVFGGNQPITTGEWGGRGRGAWLMVMRVADVDVMLLFVLRRRRRIDRRWCLPRHGRRCRYPSAQPLCRRLV